jgi:exodeoxyribonuclease VII large subunit
LTGALAGGLARHRAGLDRAAGGLRRSLIEDRLAHFRRAVSFAARHLEDDVRRKLELRTHRLAAQAKLLETLSYHNTLERGFAVVRDAAGTPVKEAQAILPGMPLVIEFRDGAVDAHADGKSPAGVPERPRRKTDDRSRDSQGSLF